jgi:hypothetical protein
MGPRSKYGHPTPRAIPIPARPCHLRPHFVYLSQFRAVVTDDQHAARQGLVVGG